MSQMPIFKYDEFFTGPVRLLVKESQAIFTTIPRNNVEFTGSNVITISRRYRSIIHECVNNLRRDITVDNSEQIKTFKEMEVIWNLCEILLLDINQTGTLIIQLKNWIKMHFDDLGSESKEILKSMDNNCYRYNENDVADIYWNLVIKLVLRGELKRAVMLLKCHHGYEGNDQIKLVADMLERMPLSNQYIVYEFCNKWVNWSEWCKRERETGQFESNPYLLTIVRILSQDLDVYDQLASNCETWYQLMVAYLHYTDPCIKETDLSELCRRSISIFKRNQPEKHRSDEEFDKIIIAAFEYDLLQVIAHCCSYLDDNWWLVTHFVDLLHCSNQLKIHEIIESDKLRETFLRDYAATLFDDEHLWPVGVSYLDSCTVTGVHFLETLLSHIPLDINDESRAYQLISIAEKRDLTGLAKSICLLMARGWLSQTIRLDDDCIRVDKYKRTTETKLPHTSNLSNALYWAIKSGDTQIITHISDQYLYYYCKSSTFPDKSVFDTLRRTTINSERLAFVAKYHEFKQVMQNSDDDMHEAGDLIKALLASEIYPKFFCQVLLEDVKVLLENQPQTIFQMDGTKDLMRTVEEITRDEAAGDDLQLRKDLVSSKARALITRVL